MKDKKLKIGVTCYATYGGSGVIATEIGMALAQRGHHLHFIATEVPRRLNRFQQNVYFHEVEVQDYPVFTHRPYAVGLASKMVEVTTFEKLDILHVHYAVPHATSAYLAKQVLGAQAPKIITTLHGTDITLVGNDRSYLPITRFSIEQSDGVTAPSQYLRLATYDKLNVSTNCPITVIPNFVNTEKFKPDAEAKSKLPCRFFSDSQAKTKDHLIVHVSNFRPVKRIPDVIKVFAKIVETTSSHLVLIGDGPERSNAEPLVHELGLAEKVCFLGKQENFVEILQAADVFLMPSESESFGLASLEALSCAVPVISTRAGGIPEVIKHGEVGFLSDVGDIEEMARNLKNLLLDKELRTRFAQQARRCVVENFSLEKMIERYEDYYYQMLGD